MILQTEFEKVRASILLMDAELEAHLTFLGVPFEIDVDGTPCISYAGLKHTQEMLGFSTK